MRETWIAPGFHSGFGESPVADDLYEKLEHLEGEVFREVATRRTVKVLLQGESYFLKIHRGVGWGEIFKNLFQFRPPVLGARNEWLALQRLRDAGVPAMTAVLFLEQGTNPARRRSAILTQALENRTSLEDYQPHNLQEKRTLIRLVADISRRMHDAGVNHRDFYLCHFLMANDNHEDLRLIDLHRAQLRDQVPERWLVKDLGGLLFSAFDKGLTRRDLYRFMKIYRNQPLRQMLTEETQFWQKVVDRAASLYLQDHLAIPASIQRLLKVS